MIEMYTIINDEVVNKKYYKRNTTQTREHYISTLRRFFAGNHKMLSLISEYSKEFVNRNIIPYDDNFSFQIDEHYIEGTLLSDTFYTYIFEINNSVNLTLLFTKDSVKERSIFIDEVIFYLKSYGYIDILNRYHDTIQAFKYDDSHIIYVEQHKLSMRKEDD